MFDAISNIIIEYLNAENVLGAIATAYLAKGVTSFVSDKMAGSLKTWQKILCAFGAASVIAIVLPPLFHDSILWKNVPGNTILYGMASDFIYQNVIKKLSS